MQKASLGIARILTMVLFAASCFGLLMFLWISFGGPIPLQPQGYRFEAAFPEASSLVQEADVRIAGVSVGKVKSTELEKGGARTLATLEVEDKYAPIPEDTRAILRQKTLLGETYIELTPGNPDSGMLAEGGTLGSASIEQVTQIDEILRIFDPETKRAFRSWVEETAVSIDRGTSQDLNSALGNLPEFATSGRSVLEVLDEQEPAVRRLIRNTGTVFAALDAEDNALQQLIVNANETFEATSSERAALAETIQIFPTFLAESRLTLDRLREFSLDTNPLVDDLKPVADDLGPTVRDIGDLSPDLESLLVDFRPLIESSERTLPQAVRFVLGAEPVLEGLHTFLPELNPVLSYANFYRGELSDFMSLGGSALFNGLPATGGEPSRIHMLPQVALLGGNSFDHFQIKKQREFVRGNAYIGPGSFLGALTEGAIPSFDCSQTGGVRENPSADPPLPPCVVQGDYGWDAGNLYPLVRGQRPPVEGGGAIPMPVPFPEREGEAATPEEAR